ncbi:MAG: DUF4358 domain-containing protein [Clostridia bacterium]|nr:DUF4358 domain-containing protein [Clostridia bacterium]
MKKNLTFLIVIAILLTSFASCGEKREVVIDINSLAAEFDKIYEGTEIELVDITESEAIDIHYGIKGLYSASRIKGSVTISSDEYVVLECFDEAGAEKAYELLDEYRRERIKLFASYATEQVPKLENAISKHIGKYVIFVVAENTDMANEILKGYIG